MPIRKFPIPPGVNREGSKHSVGAQWYEAQNMRFRDEYPETIGGWSQRENHTLQGFGRGIHSWSDFDDNQYICVGTHFKFYLLVGSNKYDITPTRLERSGGSSLTNPITTNITSGTESQVTITDVGHGAGVNDFVRFDSVASAVGGLATTVFTTPVEGFQIFEIIDDDNFKIDVGTNATSAATGGGSVDLHYKATSGSVSDTSGSGWGVGAWEGMT